MSGMTGNLIRYMSILRDNRERVVGRSLTPLAASVSVAVRMIVKTACERLLSLFMFVAATVRDLLPSSIKLSIS